SSPPPPPPSPPRFPYTTLFRSNTRLPSPAAALANSLHAHAYDFDDTHERGDMHGYAVVLPAALATAERIGNVSGRDLLVAVSIRSEEHTSELQSRGHLVCRLLL